MAVDPQSPCVAAARQARADPLNVGAALMWAACVVDQADASAGTRPFRHLLVLDPGGVGWAAWGRRTLSAGDSLEAARLLARAVVATPDRAQTRSDYANALQALKSPTALKQAASALSLAPDNPDYLYNMGCEHHDADRLDAALRLFAWALRVSPMHAESRARIGACILVRHGGASAAGWFCGALATAPSLPAALTGRGLAAGWAGQGDQAALMWHDRAVRVAPTFAEAVLNRGLILLEKGDLFAGWADYEARFASRGYIDASPIAPRLQDESSAGKKLYVWREQGVGDEILFSSCLVDTAAEASAGGVTVACDRRLVDLFTRSFPSLRFVADSASVPPGYDYQTPMGSLPRRYRRRLSDFPGDEGGWLRPDPITVARLRAKLSELPPGLNVGLAWTSGLVTSDRAPAYTALADWAPLLRMPVVNIVNLQYGDREAEIIAAERQFGVVIHRWPELDLKDDLDQTAALTAALDLVICPATAVGELAAGVGTPVWRAAWPDWTLLGARARPWCGAQRVFSPRSGETMRDVPARIAAALKGCAAAARRPSPAPSPTGGFDDALRLYQAGDIDGAAALCAALLRRPPVAARLRHLAAVIANRRNRPQEAVALSAAMIGGEDETPAVVSVLLSALKKCAVDAAAKDRPGDALSLYLRAAALVPDDRAALVNGAAAALALRRGADARALLRRALLLDAGDAAALCNLARAHEITGDEAGAEAIYGQVTALEPGNAVAHYNLGLLRLKRGALRQGWAEHDWRFATPQFAGQGRRLSAPLWRGENIGGKTLLIWREQGVGDEILFASCYQEAITRARVVYIQCDRRLTSLFARSFPGARISPDGAAAPDCDVHIPAGSLPRRLRPAPERFPMTTAGWLTPDPARVAFWRERLNKLGPGLKIGLVWRSGLITTERASAYIGLPDWAPVFEIPGVRLVNLQYGDTAEEIAAARRHFGVDIAVWGDLDLKNDFENTAALTACLDLVLTPATAAGELAGALGVPVWRLGAKDWTQLGCGVRPWFPSMRVWSPAPAPGAELCGAARAVAGALRRLSDETGAFDRKALVGERIAVARAAFAVGRLEQAATAFGAALSVDSSCDAAWAGLGAVFAERGDPLRAEAALIRALALAPADPAALTTLGNTVAALSFSRRAAALHRRAVRTAPLLAPAWDNLGVVLLGLGDDGGAEAAHHRALEADAENSGAWSNLAAALRRQGRFVESAAALRQIERAPLAGRWMERGRRLAPESHAIAFNHGAALLAVGRLAEGWEGYERRYLAPELAGAAPDLPMPPWRGESLAGRCLLVWGEQGVGDQILFAGMLPDVIAKAEREGGRIVLAAEPRLAPLFRHSFPKATVDGDIDAAAQGADFHCGLATLGVHFRRRIGDFPSVPAYLRPSAGLCALWRERAAALSPGLRVGLAWRSGLLTGERRSEYTDLGAWGGLWSLPGVQVVNLLYGAEAETADAARQGGRLHGWGDLDLKNDFESVAALMVNLDLVISPASSVGELAAAVGTPTWRFAGAGDWTRMGTAVRPWLPAQRIFTPRGGESLSDVAQRMIDRLSGMSD
jgi:tetratricopeptide (TPR) repeat protein/ADP-heptose:LPS heptosyltransferase